MLCFFSATYSTLFGSLPCSRSAAHKYLPHVANSSIQVYSVCDHINLIYLCLNCVLEWISIPRIQTGLMVNCVCQVAWWSFCCEIWKDGKKGAGTIPPEVLSYVTSEQYKWMHWTVTTPLAEVDKLLNYWSTIAISDTCAECELINLTWLFLLGMFCCMGLMMFILSICTSVNPLPLLLIVAAQNWFLSYHCLSVQLRLQSSSWIFN